MAETISNPNAESAATCYKHPSGDKWRVRFDTGGRRAVVVWVDEVEMPDRDENMFAEWEKWQRG